MTLAILLQLVTTIAALLAIAASLKSSRSQLLSAKEITIAQIEASKEQVSKEIAATVLSANRQAWINDLRNTLANFVVATHHLKTFLLIPAEQRKFESIAIATNDAWLHLSRLRLLANPNEEDHKELVNLSNALLDSVRDHTLDSKKIERDLFLKGQIVLKREWERVKSLS